MLLELVQRETCIVLDRADRVLVKPKNEGYLISFGSPEDLSFTCLVQEVFNSNYAPPLHPSDGLRYFICSVYLGGYPKGSSFQSWAWRWSCKEPGKTIWNFMSVLKICREVYRMMEFTNIFKVTRKIVLHSYFWSSEKFIAGRKSYNSLVAGDKWFCSFRIG